MRLPIVETQRANQNAQYANVRPERIGAESDESDPAGLNGDAGASDRRRRRDLRARCGERRRDCGHGLGAASLVVAPSLREGAAPVSIVASTDMPGLTSAPSEGLLSSTIFTGTRWTTLVKFPVALSGGSSAKVLPVPGDPRGP